MGVGDSRRVQRPAWRPRVAAVAPVVVALLVAACSGGGSDASADPDAPTSDSSEPADTPSTTSPAETTTSTPPGPVVPEEAPEIINTGDDFEAIYRSLNEFVNWLGMHPDPNLVDLVYHPGRVPNQRVREAIETRNAEGIAATGPQQEVTEIENRGVGESGLANLVVSFSYPAVELVDSKGEVVESRTASDVPPARYLISLVEVDRRWRIHTEEPLGG